MSGCIRERDRHQHIRRHLIIEVKVDAQAIKETRIETDIQCFLFFPGQIVILHGRNSETLVSVVKTCTDQS